MKFVADGEQVSDPECTSREFYQLSSALGLNMASGQCALF